MHKVVQFSIRRLLCSEIVGYCIMKRELMRGYASYKGITNVVKFYFHDIVFFDP